MINSIPNHFSYLFENKNGQSANKKKSIMKNKDNTLKSFNTKRKQNQVGQKEMKKEEEVNFMLELNDKKRKNEISSGLSFSSMQQTETNLFSLNLNEEKNSYYFESKMELDAPLYHSAEYQQQNYNIFDQFQLLKKSSFNQQEEMEDFDSFDENNGKNKLNKAQVNTFPEGKQQQQQQVSNLVRCQEKLINLDKRGTTESVISNNNNANKNKNNNNNNNLKSELYHHVSAESKPQEQIYWRRANQLQTKMKKKLRHQGDCNQLLLKGDLYLQINQNEYTTTFNHLPLSSYKRIIEIKKYPEGKFEVQMITDQKESEDVLLAKNEEGGSSHNLKSSSLEQQMKDYLQKVEQQQQTFLSVKSQSANIIEQLKAHVNMKREQSLNKIDFERKYIFAVEYQVDEQEGISSIHKVYYSKGFFNILGLDGKDSALVEAFLLKNGIIDLHEQLGLYKEIKGSELKSQYLEVLGENQYKLNTLDNLQVSVSINHQIINLSEEFHQMFSEIGLANSSKDFLIKYELDVPYDQIKQIEGERRSNQNKGTPIFFSNSLPNVLLDKYYSASICKTSPSQA